MNPLLNYLSTHSVSDLVEEYKIKVNHHTLYNLISLKYDQINSPHNDPVVNVCRGIVLDESNNIVAYPYDRFFNIEEPCAASVDFDSACVYEKIDGSLMTLYYYDDKWNVASSGSPDAAGMVGDFGFSFAELFWRVWNELGYKLPNDTSKCYMFELMTAYNKVVVNHGKNRIVLHGARDLNTLEELFPFSVAKENGWECVRVFDYRNIDDVVNAASGLSGILNEGFVVCDKNFNRVKIKSPEYVRYSHLKDGSNSKKNILELVIRNEGDEFLSYFPELEGQFIKIQNTYNDFLKMVWNDFLELRNIDDQKQFALAVKDKRYSCILFLLRSGKIKAVDNWFGLVTTDKAIKMLEI